LDAFASSDGMVPVNELPRRRLFGRKRKKIGEEKEGRKITQYKSVKL